MPVHINNNTEKSQMAMCIRTVSTRLGVYRGRF